MTNPLSPLRMMLSTTSPKKQIPSNQFINESTDYNISHFFESVFTAFCGGRFGTCDTNSATALCSGGRCIEWKRKRCFTGDRHHYSSKNC